MESLKELKNTENIDSDKHCIKSIHKRGSKFFAFLYKWSNEGQYFEISEDLAKIIMNDMDEFIIIHLKWNDGDYKINQDGTYISSSFKISTINPMDDVF